MGKTERELYFEYVQRIEDLATAGYEALDNGAAGNGKRLYNEIRRQARGVMSLILRNAERDNGVRDQSVQNY